MAALTLQTAPHTGLNPATQTTSLGGTTGNTAPCGNGFALVLINGAAATVLITLKVPAATTVDGLAISNRTLTLPAVSGAITVIPLPITPFADPVTGLATFDVAAGTVNGFVLAISQ